jgi:hypothetical protein
MYRDYTVAVVVPAYNEEQLIRLGMWFDMEYNKELR